MDASPAMVLLSGGIDSATALGVAVHSGMNPIYLLHVVYGSLHETRETEAAQLVTNFYKNNYPPVEFISINLNMRSLFEGMKSALLGTMEMPKTEYQDPVKDGPSDTVVPFRNGVIISAAAAILADKGGGLLLFAGHASDHAHWAYPDCSPEFVTGMRAAIDAGTMGAVKLFAPFIQMEKKDVVGRAARIGVPAWLTYSCYRGGAEHCGKCPTCLERIKAFTEAGFKDPAMPRQWFPKLEEWPA